MYPSFPGSEKHRLDHWCKHNCCRDRTSTVSPDHRASRWFCKHHTDGTRAGKGCPLLYFPIVVEVLFH